MDIIKPVIDSGTILFGSHSHSIEEQGPDIATIAHWDQSIDSSDIVRNRDFNTAVTQWLSDETNHQALSAAVDSQNFQQKSGNSLFETEIPARRVAAMFPKLKWQPAERFMASQKWEGLVLAVHDDIFEARLVCLEGEEEEDQFAELYIDEVDAPDRALLEVGAIFYWTIGYLHKRNGTTLRASILRFRRMPPLTQDLQRQARVVIEEWGDLFGD